MSFSYFSVHLSSLNCSLPNLYAFPTCSWNAALTFWASSKVDPRETLHECELCPCFVVFSPFITFYCSWGLTYELSIAKMVIFPEGSWFIAGAIKWCREINSALEILPHFHHERQNYDCFHSPSLLLSFIQVFKSAKWNGTPSYHSSS